ncbi:LysR family transcriptional regulator [Tolumonas osonensis]|uniref:LysR family transcriptional regulator for bpeEF and oprC n=1 Tax=Tolumonas osonensis TaxID=675874 RepID=A0A841GE65_9GAMM|nr:LysR family transcriptional regulator [Tolumonas osonensis]MBB6056219.1 LysR family transcriptional regulator for bpeEF and oprC [Tolumonas osonensis]
MEFIQTVRVFAKLAELGSFTKTAEALQLGRPQVSIVIQELETSLGVRLFHRTTRNVRLSAEGELFYEKARDILARIAEATSMFGRPGSTLHGRLRIDIPSAFAQPIFIERLKEFNAKYPELELVIGVTDRTVDLIAEGVDCVLRIGELPNSSMVARKIGSVIMVTVASPKYINEYGTPSQISELKNHKCINFLSGANNRPLAWSFRQDEEEISLSVDSSVSTNESNSYVNCAAAGFGLIQALGLSVEPMLNSGRLVEVLSSFRPTPKQVSILYPSRTYLAPQVHAFVDWLKSEFPHISPNWVK